MLAALIQFTIAYCFGLLAFWFLEIQGFVILSMAVETMLGGQIFPLDLLPAGLFKAAQFLPFYYKMYFPAAILTGRIDYPPPSTASSSRPRGSRCWPSSPISSGSAACATTRPSGDEPSLESGCRKPDSIKKHLPAKRPEPNLPRNHPVSGIPNRKS